MERDEQATITYEASCTVHFTCPLCSAPIPIVITAEVYVCDCGQHQGILTTPDMTDVFAHAVTHDDDDA